MDLKERGEHWRDEERVQRWDAAGDQIDARRKEPFERLLAQLPVDTDFPLRVVDIGAGDGRVAALVLDRYRNASAVLVDFSPPMISMGRKRLARFGDRYAYYVWDLATGDWPDDLRGPYDAAVSSAAIHHLENSRKEWLTKEVYSRLRPGGVFVNYDLFRDPCARFEEHEVHDRTCASLAESVTFLEAAGYQEILIEMRVARPQSKGEQALLAAKRPQQLQGC